MTTSPPTDGKLLPITRWGTPILHRRVRELTQSDFKTTYLETLISNMFATMYAADGCGLAANQVNVDQKLFVYDLTDKGKRSWGIVCNPVVETVSPQNHAAAKKSHQTQLTAKNTQTLTEGCLSYPGLCAPVSRPPSIIIRGSDQRGSPIELKATGLLAQILQHEVDHLNGIVYGDHVSGEVRQKMDTAFKAVQAKQTYPDDWPSSKARHVVTSWPTV